MAALMKRVWQFPVQHLYRPKEVFQLPCQVLPSLGRCCKAVHNTQALQTSRTISHSPINLSDDQTNKQQPAKETRANLSTKAAKKKKKKKDPPDVKNVPKERTKTVKKISPSIKENVKEGLRTWVLDEREGWIKSQIPAALYSTPDGQNQQNQENKGSTWFIPDLYKSKEHQEKINAAKRSILIFCNSDLSKESIAVCERMSPVSKVLIISNRTMLVTFESDISHLLDHAEEQCQSNAVSIFRMEKRVFAIKMSKKILAKEKLQPRCQNIQRASQAPIPTLKSQSIDEQMLILGKRAQSQEDYQGLMLFLRQCIQDIVDLACPDHEVLPFGSVLNGFITDNSDLDTMLLSMRGNGDIDDGKPLLKKIERILRKLKRYDNILPLYHTRVPILQYRDNVLGIRGDISYSTSGSSGKMATIYMKAISEFSPSVVPFVMTVKRWTKIYVPWYPSKFVFIAMALFYLQRCKVIPPIQELKIVEESSLGDQKKWTCSHNESPSVLLQGFFQFYKDFDFQSYDICLTSGQIIPKRQPGSTIMVNPFSTVEKSKEHFITEIRESSMNSIQSIMEESQWIMLTSPTSLLRSLR